MFNDFTKLRLVIWQKGIPSSECPRDEWRGEWRQDKDGNYVRYARFTEPQSFYAPGAAWQWIEIEAPPQASMDCN